jgi:hypothetical protein
MEFALRYGVVHLSSETGMILHVPPALGNYPFEVDYNILYVKNVLPLVEGHLTGWNIDLYLEPRTLHCNL